MGTKVLFAALYWLALNEVFGDQSTVKSSVAIDNVSAESAPPLYRNVPAGVYASAAPYGSYSFHLPKLIAAPQVASSQVVPVQQATNNGFLKDSYGNRFAATPLTLAYKTAFPQKFLPIQKLPEHLAQPLVGASANFQFKQTAPQVFVGSPYRVPAIQVPTPTPLNNYAGFLQPLVYAENTRSLAPTSVSHFVSQIAQQQPTNNKAVFTNAEPYKYYKSYKSEPKFQRIQDIPHIVYGQPNYHRIHEIPKLAYNENKSQRIQDTPQVHREEQQSERYEERLANSKKNQQGPLEDNASLQAVPAKNTVTYVTDVNGKTTIVNLKTDPPIPLLDLTLLEPLTFENPLVPQVQHFLPRISHTTYENLPQVNSQPKNHDVSKGEANKKKQKKPIQHSKPKPKPQTPVIHHETLDEVPEISYEINQPNYQEIYKEKVLSYNKETTSPPETHSYGSNIENDPVTYSYSRSSAEPNNKETSFENSKHLPYNFSPEKQSHGKKEENHSEGEENHPEEEEEEESVSQKESSLEILDDDSYHPHSEHYKESTKSSEQQPDLKYKNKDHDQIRTLKKQQQYAPSDVEVFDSRKNSSPQKQQPEKKYEQIEPITRQYEEDIRIAPTPSEDIKINPDDHVQYVKSTQQPHSSPSPQHERPPAPHYHSINSLAPQRHLDFSNSPPSNSHFSELHSSPSPIPNSYQHYSTPESDYHKAPEAHIREKSKQIIIKEETPEGLRMIAEKMREEMIQREENNEEDFEKAYHDAAYGFPNYNSKLDEKKEIFNPASYGVPPEHIEYKIEHTPFEQYQDQNDDYPKATRMSYKDTRDKTKDDYYTEYKVSQPESLHDHYRNKESYYKLYRDNKPEYLSEDIEERKEKQKPNSAKYIVAPTRSYSSEQKPKSYYGSYQPRQQLYDYNYHKPRDNSAFASRPLQMYKIKTNFVEPQFQYGFEPISIPKLLDSELAAMSSNLNPESEKPGMRKKIYKENWYIKQTSMSAGDPAS